jgi:hypothetical protein
MTSRREIALDRRALKHFLAIELRKRLSSNKKSAALLTLFVSLVKY